jgi:predicted ATPase
MKTLIEGRPQSLTTGGRPRIDLQPSRSTRGARRDTTVQLLVHRTWYVGVFAGGCDLDALAAVAGRRDGQQTDADPLQLAEELMDVSLITVSEGADGEPRFAMLETIREYALERLRHAADLDSTRRRHARYYAAFAEQAPDQRRSLAGLAHLDRLEAEHDNLRAALSWSLEAGAVDPASDSDRAAIGLRLV